MDRARQYIEAALRSVAEAEGCRVVLAVESGSRAWGFPSADSDYDVRFIYLCELEWYLSVHERRDVIERPLDENLIDLAGWDLKKVLRLLRKSNPPLLEWLQSPIIYHEFSSVPGRLRELMKQLYSPRACLYHYLHMARGNYRDYLQRERVRVKKYLYVLRPILACRWIEADLGLVPMEFQTLIEKVLPSGEIEREVMRLLDEKRAGIELDEGPQRPVLNAFLEAELDRFERCTAPEAPGIDDSQLDALFRESFLKVWNRTVL